MSEPIITVDGLSVAFPTPVGTVRAVNDVSFDVRGGETLAVVGESGSGKSVSALALMGLLPDTAQVSGSAMFGGQDLLAMSQRELRSIRGGEIAMIFQDPMTAMNPLFSVGNQIAEAVSVHQPDRTKDEAFGRAIDLLDIVGVPEPARRARQYPHEFSGGMRQRAMIAMAMANDPMLLIADEPTTALDVTIQAQVVEVMQAAQEATGAAIMMITHDLGLVAGLADRVQVMYGGRIVEAGSTDDIFYRSLNPYTRGLMRSIPQLGPRRADRLVPIAGTPPSLVNLPQGCAFNPRCEYRTDICDEVPDLATVAPGHQSRCHHSADLEPLETAGQGA